MKKLGFGVLILVLAPLSAMATGCEPGGDVPHAPAAEGTEPVDATIAHLLDVYAHAQTFEGLPPEDALVVDVVGEVIAGLEEQDRVYLERFHADYLAPAGLDVVDLLRNPELMDSVGFQDDPEIQRIGHAVRERIATLFDVGPGDGLGESSQAFTLGEVVVVVVAAAVFAYIVHEAMDYEKAKINAQTIAQFCFQCQQAWVSALATPKALNCAEQGKSLVYQCSADGTSKGGAEIQGQAEGVDISSNGSGELGLVCQIGCS